MPDMSLLDLDLEPDDPSTVLRATRLTPETTDGEWRAAWKAIGDLWNAGSQIEATLGADRLVHEWRALERTGFVCDARWSRPAMMMPRKIALWIVRHDEDMRILLATAPRPWARPV
jgi:hypothetical protein